MAVIAGSCRHCGPDPQSDSSPCVGEMPEHVRHDVLHDVRHDVLRDVLHYWHLKREVQRCMTAASSKRSEALRAAAPIL